MTYLLDGVEATYPERDGGDGATRKPLGLLDKIIEYPDGLVEERARQGRIEMGPEADTHVDRLYPEIKDERHDGLCRADPLFIDSVYKAWIYNFRRLIGAHTDSAPLCDEPEREDLVSSGRAAQSRVTGRAMAYICHDQLLQSAKPSSCRWRQ